MTTKFTRSILRVVVAQLCQTIGWHAVNTTPFELLTDVLQKYIVELAENAHRYAEQFGHTDPTLHDLGLAFRDMGISISELEEYVENVPSVPFPKEIPKYPTERENHLNLLKPGSREVVTRPVHIHEHLPAMHPELEDEEYSVKSSTLSVDTTAGVECASPPLTSPKINLFKRPGDPITMESSALKRARLMIEEEGRPLREISSVMMTTSGFLSPAREGKLPEARTPATTTDSNSRSNSPQPSPSSYPTVPPEVKGEKKTKKNPPIKPGLEGIKKLDVEGILKELPSTELPVTEDDDSKVKKLVSMKELTKLKALKSGALKMMSQNNPNSSNHLNKPNPKLIKNKFPPESVAVRSGLNVLIPKISKIPSAKSPKVEMSNPSSLLNQHKLPVPEKIKTGGNIDGKLPSEPDKQKLNIFKKISKVKEENKVDYSEGFNKNFNESTVNSGNGLAREARLAQINEVIESVIQRSRDDSNNKEPPIPEHPLSDNDSFQFDSPPGTPRTPELPIIQRKSESKKKKKDKIKEKRENKEKFLSSPKHIIKSEPFEPEFMEKPKTPEVETSHDDSVGGGCSIGGSSIPPVIPTPTPVFPFYPNFPTAPGLIPPIGHPGLYPRFPSMGKHGGLIPPTITNLPLHPPLFLQPHHPSIVEESPPPKTKHVPPITTTANIAPPPSIPPSVPAPSISLNQFQPTPIIPPISAVKVEPLDKSSTSSTVTSHPKEKSKDERKKEHKKEKKDRIKKKKDKKDKMKNKDKSEKKRDKTEKKERDKEKIKEKKEKKEKKREKEREQQAMVAAAEKPEEKPAVATSSNSGSSVPKITFKLGPASPQPVQQPAPVTPETPHRKIVIKPVKKPEETAEERPKRTEEPSREVSQPGREPSPELARICALVTRPPKQKSTSKTQFPVEPNLASPVPSKPKKPILSQPITTATNATTTTTTTASTPKVKSKDISKKPLKETEPVKEPVAVPYYYDTEGNQVWICPGCGGQDDGSPMIGCDGCDAWYHWVCVGIQVPPDSNDWFCRVCIGKKDEIVGEKKKKIRKKKNLA
ncbi:TBP-associated factor 3 [Lycorma delicatula]|uniref:TBP-associated factor 3 n=1 Tax=Lycorma delicatula TaxID=130591 RepID=UPI003F51A7F8